MTAAFKTLLKVSFVAGLAAASTLLGALYAICNTDAQHWGFILGTALDFIHGRSLYTDVYVQYGAGQPLLFDLLSHAMPINYTTIGFVASVAYAFTLVALFLGVQKLTSTSNALALCAIAFLTHPYAVYPWPDYFAGLCLCVAACILLNRAPRSSGVGAAASGLLLFLAFSFRNTYLVSILLAMLLYLAVALPCRRLRSRDVVVAIAVFATLACGYFASLYGSGTLPAWYAEDFGAALETYGVGAHSVHMLILNILYPDDLQSWTFLGLLAINGWVIGKMVSTRDARWTATGSTASGNVIFLALLGVSGAAQCLQLYEVFRLQNAGISLYFGLAFFLSMYFPKDAQWRLRVGLDLSLVALIAALVVTFGSLLDGGNKSIVWPIVGDPVEGLADRHSIADSLSRGSAPDAAIFRGHRFQPEVRRYYDDLVRHLCDGRSRIVNLTGDATIPYLCAGQENALALPFYSELLLARITPREADAMRKGQFTEDEVVVADSTHVFGPVSSTRLERIATVTRPAAIRWLVPGDVHVFHVAPGR